MVPVRHWFYTKIRYSIRSMLLGWIKHALDVLWLHLLRKNVITLFFNKYDNLCCRK